MKNLSKLIAIVAILTLPIAGLAQEKTTAPSEGMYVGALGSLSFMIEPSDDTDPYGWFGAEFGMKNFNLQVEFHPGDVFNLSARALYMYDISLDSMMKNLWVSANGGLLFNYASISDVDYTAIGVGLTVGARLTYMVSPQLGLFLTPVSLDMPLYVNASMGDISDSDFDFNLAYRAAIGANYRF